MNIHAMIKINLLIYVDDCAENEILLIICSTNEAIK